jgi:hypothetical protein
MTIAEFSFGRERSVIGYFGEQPPSEALKIFADMGYQIEPFGAAELIDSEALATTDSVIFSQSLQKPTRIFGDLDLYAKTLLSQDCRIYLRVAQPEFHSDRMRAIVVNAIDTLKLPPSGLSDDEGDSLGEWFCEHKLSAFAPFVHLCGRPNDWSEIAKTIRDNPAGKAPNLSMSVDAVNSKGDALKLTDEQLMLIRRAFWNCASVHLVGMTNGLSGVPAFRAYAELAQGLPGKWPYLYFVKIGSRQKISTEYRMYQANALEYIPYHLGPRLRQDRCGLAASEGIIVGDYVSGSESLRDCAKDGRAAPAIANLFNSTLWAWRQVATTKKGSVPEYLEHLFPTSIPRHREDYIRELGATLSVTELKDLFMACNENPVLAGPIHGDLHATNVLVRSADAIVIDFEKVGFDMPLVYDAASLEGGLLVDCFIGDQRSPASWLESIRSLYDGAAFGDEVIPCHPKDRSAWYFDCVRQIRIHARQLERAPRQYAVALALALAKKACNPEDFRDDSGTKPAPSQHMTREHLRAAAYVLAEQILKTISKPSST